MLRRWRTHELSAIASMSCKGRGGGRVELNALCRREKVAQRAQNGRGVRRARAWRYVRWDPLLKGFNGVKFRVAVGRWFCVRNGEGASRDARNERRRRQSWSGGEMKHALD